MTKLGDFQPNNSQHNSATAEAAAAKLGPRQIVFEVDNFPKVIIKKFNR